MFDTYLPRSADHFPSLRRGHGRGLGKRRPAPAFPKGYRTVRQHCAAGGERCVKCHEPGNVQDWLDERGLKAIPW